MLHNITILMTGAGAPGAPGILRCYKNNGERRIRVVGADIRAQVPTICDLDAFFQIPRPTSENFCEHILQIAEKESVDVIQPLVTKELEIFSSSRNLFEQSGIKVCCSDSKGLEIANNKRKLLEFMKSRQMKVPTFFTVHNVSEFEEACINLGYPDKPVCFKPSVGNGSRGFRILDHTKDFEKLLFEEKPTSTYSSMEQILSILKSARALPELLVMEYLPGDEYSVDILANHGMVVVAVPRKRLQMNGGISTDCVVAENMEITDYCAQIIKALNLDGNIGIQVRADREGVFKILEINPRVQGSIVACAAAGANLPYLAIKQALGEPVGDIHIKWGTEMLRCWTEVYYDHTGHAFTY